ncbi:MAG TPA: hypothetical protein VK888_05520 [Anaerolineales bacterium]|nr:hypothetical protein [Anaerolineales bacterium]
MAYAFTNSKGVTYYLHTKKSTTSTGKERTLFYFAKEVKEGTLDSVPEGYKVVEMKTGLPVLKKTGGEAEPEMEAAREGTPESTPEAAPEAAGE